jgi:hypothetical protein
MSDKEQTNKCSKKPVNSMSYVIVLVLYILLSIIIGACIF